MPSSYYSKSPSLKFSNVLAQLLTTDFYQYVLHRIEHVSPYSIYAETHKPHHRYNKPTMFDAFDGSVWDTTIMILLPLYFTTITLEGFGVDVTVWEYMTFGSIYSTLLTLIHSEKPHRFELLHRLLGIGTTWDHHVHHSLFGWNFGHCFMYWDFFCGTWRDAWGVKRFRKVEV